MVDPVGACPRPGPGPVWYVNFRALGPRRVPTRPARISARGQCDPLGRTQQDPYREAFTYCQFSFWIGKGIIHGCHGMASLVHGSNSRCALHHCPSLARSKGSWGQLWPNTDPRQQTTAQIVRRRAYATWDGEPSSSARALSRVRRRFGIARTPHHARHTRVHSRNRCLLCSPTPGGLSPGDARHQTPKARHQTPDTKSQTPDTSRQTPDTGRQTPETPDQRPESGRTPSVFIPRMTAAGSSGHLVFVLLCCGAAGTGCPRGNLPGDPTNARLGPRGGPQAGAPCPRHRSKPYPPTRGGSA